MEFCGLGLEGGESAKKWAEELERMVWRRAARLGIPSLSEAQSGAILRLRASEAQALLPMCRLYKFVEREPLGGKTHTSFARVVARPVSAQAQAPSAAQLEALSRELIVRAQRSSGPGGQNVNKRSSAVRAWHEASGLDVRVQQERSQHENRRIAVGLIAQKLLEREGQALAQNKRQDWERQANGGFGFSGEAVRFEIRRRCEGQVWGPQGQRCDARETLSGRGLWELDGVGIPRR